MNDDLVSLREFLTQQISALAARETARAEAHAQQHAEQRQAVNLAAGLMNERLADMNQFRAQLDRQAALFVTRDQLAIILETRTVGHEKDLATVKLAHEKDVAALEERGAAMLQRLDLLEKRNALQDGRFIAVMSGLALLAIALPLLLHYLFP